MPSQRTSVPRWTRTVLQTRSGGGTIPEDMVRDISVPTLVIAGGASPNFFRETADQVTRLLPNAEQTVLEGQDHGASAEVAAPVVAAFLQGA